MVASSACRRAKRRTAASNDLRPRTTAASQAMETWCLRTWTDALSLALALAQVSFPRTSVTLLSLRK